MPVSGRDGYPVDRIYHGGPYQGERVSSFAAGYAGGGPHGYRRRVARAQQQRDWRVKYARITIPIYATVAIVIFVTVFIFLTQLRGS